MILVEMQYPGRPVRRVLPKEVSAVIRAWRGQADRLHDCRLTFKSAPAYIDPQTGDCIRPLITKISNNYQ